MKINHYKQGRRKEKIKRSVYVCERNRTVMCLCSKAFMLPSEPAGLDSNQTHQCSPLSRHLSLCLLNKSKMLLSSKVEEAVISTLWWVSWSRSGFCIFCWLIQLQQLSTVIQVVHGNANSKAVILFTWGDDAHSNSVTHAAVTNATAGGGGHEIRHQVHSASVAW